MKNYFLFDVVIRSVEISFQDHLPDVFGDLAEDFLLDQVDQLQAVAERLVRIINPFGFFFEVELLADLLIGNVDPAILLFRLLESFHDTRRFIICISNRILTIF